MKLNLKFLILFSALLYTSNDNASAKNDLNKVLKQFGVQNQDQKRSNSGRESHSALSEAKKAEIRLINNFLEGLRTIKAQIEKQEKELMDAKEKLLMN